MILLNGENLTISDVMSIAQAGTPITIPNESLDKITKSHNFLTDFASSRFIYGINTGFGPMAQFKIDDNKLIDLQYNLVRSHSAGFTPFISLVESRAVLIARINSLVRGLSGVSPDLINLLVSMCNKGIVPCIPKHGGVGASGDLVQLAHLALAAIGEGDVYYKDEIVKASVAFQNEGLSPMKFSIREGISIMNGTSAMTGVAALNLFQARILLQWMVVFSSMINEIMEAFDDHFSVELNSAKKHQGQKHIASLMRNILSDSKLIRLRDKFWSKEQSNEFFSEKVQEYYSVRCVPQILGPIYDTIENAVRVVEEELNSTSDNPIVDFEAGNVFHGGNFHGDYISLEMDKLKLVTTKLSMLAERQLNFLLNNAINGKLPPFININTLGLNFGLQGMQFCATSTTAENQTISGSSYIHSIPNNNDNQDIVSMGFNSASLASKIVENAFEVITIEAIALLQAIDYLGIEKKLSAYNGRVFKELRAVFPLIKEDRATYIDQKALKSYLMNHNPNLGE